jgi:WD40 repeat protein
VSPSRRTNQDRWPPSGPHRRLLEHLDKVRENEGRRTYAEIATAAHLAQSRISEFLTGSAMPSETNVEQVVRAMGGGDDDVRTAHRLLAKCLADGRRQGPRSRPQSRSTPPDHSALSQAIQDTTVLWRDLGLREFTGRTELIDSILRFIESRPRGYVVVRAEAGIGKTALAAHLVHEHDFVYHFTGVANGRSVAHAFRNLCAQLIRRYGVSGSDALPSDASSFEGFWQVLTTVLAARGSDRPVVIVIDGMDEFEFPSSMASSLGLPATLPDGVFVIITSRFGGEARLTGLRKPSEWLTIDVESSSNISDMRDYVDRVTDPVRGDPQLVERIAGMDVARLRHALVAHCAGVWIYLKYVLDEIREGTRAADDVDRLPADLGGYYAHNIMMWRGDVQDPLATDKWRLVTLPVITTLAAMREPLSAKEIAHLANVDPHQASAFLSATARAFLNRNQVDGTTLYSIRHESFRDVLRGKDDTMSMPAMSLLADDLHDAFADVDARFVQALVPSGWPDRGLWDDCSAYAKRHLAHHAAACGRLDALLADAGFHVTVSAESILTNSATVHTEAGRLAARVLFLSLQDWEEANTDQRLSFVNMWATRLRAHEVAASSATLLNRRWRIAAASSEWPGKRRLSERESTALDIGTVGGRTIIASGYWDGGVSIFDADTGVEIDALSGPDESGWVRRIRIVQAADRAVLVAAWAGLSVHTPLRAWDALTRKSLWRLDLEVGVLALEALEVNGRAVIVYTRDLDEITPDDADGMILRDLHSGEKLSGIKLESVGRHLAVAEIGERKIVALSGVGIFELDDSFSLAKIMESEEPWLAGAWPLAFDESAESPTLVVGIRNHVEFVDPLTGKTIDEPLVVGVEKAWICGLWAGGINGRRVLFVGMEIEGFTNEVEASLWDRNTRRKLDALGRREGEDITVTAHDRDARGIAAVGSSDGLQVWEPRTDETNGVLDSPLPVHHLSFTRHDGRNVVVAGSGLYDAFGRVAVYDTKTQKVIAPPVEWHECYVKTASIYSLDGRSIILAGSPRGARMWDLRTSELLVEVSNNDTGSISAVEIVPSEGRHLAFLANDQGTIFAYVVSPNVSLSRFYEIPTHTAGEATAIGLGSVRGRRVAVISDENDVLRMYDVVSGEQLGKPLRGAERTNAIAICDLDGRCMVVSCGRSGEVRRSEPSSGDSGGHRLRKADDPLWAVACGYVDRHAALVTGGASGLLTVLDVMTGSVLERDLRGHRDNIYTVIMDDTGRIVSGGEDGVLTWWAPTREVSDD